MITEKSTAFPLDICPVVSTLTALRAQLRRSDSAPQRLRAALASSARIVTEITLGRGTPAHLAELDVLSKELSIIEPDAGSILSATLAAKQDEWQKHVTRLACSAKACIQPRKVPCQEACPAHIDIPSMIAYIANGQYKESLEVLLKDTPLPNSCGLVCPAPCEEACVQNTVSVAVAIKPMKSVAARCSGGYALPECAVPSGKNVAVVGSGPAGLTAAYYLAQKGHQVDIFDERDEAGGIMRYGIPNYRLPAEVLNAEINMVKALGVKIHTGNTVTNFDNLKKMGFDALFLATGLQHSRGLGVPGDDQPFVLGGMDFLRKVRHGENPQVGPHVIVIGGGNVAVDVAMTSFRQGASKVEVWYRRTRKDMPASSHEVSMALDEGVQLIELWAPVQVLAGNLIEFARSKNAPDAATTPNVIVHADQIIGCIGQDADLTYLDGSAIELKSSNIVVDPVTLMTGELGVFSGGDIAHGPSTVVAAIGSGKRAAESIHAFLTGSDMDHASLKPQRRASVQVVSVGAIARADPYRPRVPEKEPLQRRTSHDAILFDFDEGVAKIEAGRCLRCDLCIGCGLCELVCTEVGANALRMIDAKNGRLVFDGFVRSATLCIGCGACAAVCPTGAITVETVDNERITSITGTVVCHQSLLTCSVCNELSITTAQYEAMCKRIDADAHDPYICPKCLRANAGMAMLEMQWAHDA